MTGAGELVKLVITFRSPDPQREARARAALCEEARAFGLEPAETSAGEVVIEASRGAASAFKLHLFGWFQEVGCSVR